MSIIFKDKPNFKPNKTPKEILTEGSFGGTYFRPIYSSINKKKYNNEYLEFPTDWYPNLNYIINVKYNKNINKYKVKCGTSLELWEKKKWIHPQDPYGWFQWYCRFFLGRRTLDDDRQITRWNNFAGDNGRWRNNLILKIYNSNSEYNDYKISPVIRQSLLHWGYELTKKDYNNYFIKKNNV